jgi:hypothetical protein
MINGTFVIPWAARVDSILWMPGMTPPSTSAAAGMAVGSTQRFTPEPCENGYGWRSSQLNIEPVSPAENSDSR